MEDSKARFVAFWDEENTRHYGFLLADGQTIVCGDCGGTFDAFEDALILQSCAWDADAVEAFIEAHLFCAQENGSLD